MSDQADLLIRDAMVIAPEVAISGGAVAVSEGRIVYAGPAAGAPGAAAYCDAGGGFLLPGFVDLHCHGGGGYDSLAGRYDPATRGFEGSPEELRKGLRVIAATHAAHGTTTMCLATCAGPEGPLAAALSAIGEAAAAGDCAARILGVNLEGGYIKMKEFAGAQNPEHFRHPSAADFDRLNAAARGAIRICNVAPEHGYPAADLVRHLVERGVVAASGHSGASYAEMKSAIDAGVTLAVHFSNGPMSTTFKPPGMVIEAILGDPRVTVELIADGCHINPPYLLSFLAAKRFRAALITDAMAPTGAAGIARFTLSGKTGELSADGGVLRLQGSATTLFGSVLTMDRAVANVVKWLSEGLPGMYQNAPVIDPPPSREEALVLASRLSSGYPAEVLGLRREMGAIEPGLAADLVLLDENLAAQRVWRGGLEVQIEKTSAK